MKEDEWRRETNGEGSCCVQCCHSHKFLPLFVHNVKVPTNTTKHNHCMRSDGGSSTFHARAWSAIRFTSGSIISRLVPFVFPGIKLHMSLRRKIPSQPPNKTLRFCSASRRGGSNSFSTPFTLMANQASIHASD
jgi:hypothetical protein